MKKTFILIVFFFILNTIQAQFWQSTNGPKGGMYWDMSSNTNTGITYLVVHWTRLKGNGLGSNIYSSINAGGSWTEIDNGLKGQPVYKLASSNTAPHLIIAVMDTMSPLSAAVPNKIYFSNDQGTSWILSNSTYFAGNLPPNTLQFNPTGDTIYAGQKTSGVSFSIDNGISWQTSNGGITNRNITDLEYGLNGNLYACTDSVAGNGAKVFMKNGNAWVDVSTGLSGTRIADLYYDAANATMYLGTGSFSNGAGEVYRSINGSAWTAIPGYPGAEAQRMLTTNTGDLLVRILNQGIWKYASGIWTNTSANLGSLRTATLSKDNAGVILATTKAGIWKYDEANSSWLYYTNGIKNSQVRAMAFSNVGDLLAGTDNGIYRSVDGGNSWGQVGLKDTIMMSVSLNPTTNKMYAGNTDNNGSKIFSSANDGLSWFNNSTGVNTTRTTDFAFNKQGKIFCGSGWASPVHTSADGINWNGPLWSSLGFSQARVVIAVATDSSDRIFAGTEAIGVYRSLDNGLSYQWAGFSGGDVTDIQISPNQAVFVAHNIAGNSSGFLYRSNDHGATWTSNLMINRGYTNCIFVASDDSIFVGTTLGVWLSTDYGNSWSELNGGLNDGNLIIHSLELGKDGYLYAGTAGAGIYKSINPIKSTITSTPNNQLSSFYQVYPNPSFGNFTVELSTEKSRVFKFELMNQMGRSIYQKDHPLEKGKHQIDVELTLPSGLYLLRVSGADHRSTQKIMIR